MTIQFVSYEDAARFGTEERRVLLEQKPDHYPEFLQTLEEETPAGGLFFRGPSGQGYLVRKTAGSDGLSGIEVVLKAETGRTAAVSDETIDLDLWAFLEWLVEKVGGEWSGSALAKTGAIYRVPGASR